REQQIELDLPARFRTPMPDGVRAPPREHREPIARLAPRALAVSDHVCAARLPVMPLLLHGLTPIHWALAGAVIAAVTATMLLVAKRRLGVSTGLEDICSL